jgi:uncharacterized protein
MPAKFLELATTPAVRIAQRRYYGRTDVAGTAPASEVLGQEETEFVRARDSFYLSTISESGWPYIQHRGGPPGFLQVLSPTVLAFADFQGNRQLLSTGNLATNDRVALFLMDYPQRTRLKIIGHGRVEDIRGRSDLIERFAAPSQRRVAERVFMIDVVAFDWNCPKFITPRYTAAEFAGRG